MPQPPFLTDQIQIAPAEAGDRIIGVAADGSFQFTDPNLGLVSLKTLGSLATAPRVLIVQSGDSIQTALDSIPATSSSSQPWLVLITPGVYQEHLNVYRDGVTLQGLGRVVIQSPELVVDGPAADHTVTFSSSMGTTAQDVRLAGLIIQSIHNTKSCLYAQGVAGGTLGLEAIRIENCLIQGQGFALNINVVNNFYVDNSSFTGSSTLCFGLIAQCARAVFNNVSDLPALSMVYDTTNPIPVTVGSYYALQSCLNAGVDSVLAPQFNSVLRGAGALEVYASNLGNVVLVGDRSALLSNSTIGNLTLSETMACTLSETRRGTIAGPGTATLKETGVFGVVSFVAVSTVAVSFTLPQPDDAYTVSLELSDFPNNGEPPFLTLKSANGFTISFNTAQTLDVRWVVLRSI